MAPFTLYVSQIPAAELPQEPAFLSCAGLAARYRCPLPALRKCLERWRERHPFSDRWIECANPGVHQPRYLYCIETVQFLCLAVASLPRHFRPRPPSIGNTSFRT